jgi:hypothetical protein
MKPSFHEDLSRSVAARGSSDRSLGLFLALLFILLGMRPIVQQQGHLRPWLILTAAAFLLVALLRPGWLHPLNRAFTSLGFMLGKITNPIATTVLFFLVIAPVGCFSRLRGKDPLRMKTVPKADSYWIPRVPPGPAPNTMSKQF